MAVISTAIHKEQLMHAIEPEVAKIDHAMKLDLQEATAEADPLLSEILDYGIFNGGKRLRPLLVVLAAHLCARMRKYEQNDSIYKLSIAFEYLHGATLFHDDVIDNAEIRRGKASVNEEFGVIAAILGGDFLHSRSMYIIGTLGGKAALEVFCDATNAMVDGEFLQLRNSKKFDVSEDEYFEAVKGKTALLIAATCEIGALAAGGTVAEQQALAEYGISLGTAFQIVDDLLDYQGDPQKTGKVVGNDFREGKSTLPVILAMASANSKDRGRLLFLLENEDARRNGYDEAYALIEKYDGFKQSRKKAELIVEKAVSGLDIFSDDECQSVIAVLNALAQYVLSREK